MVPNLVFTIIPDTGEGCRLWIYQVAPLGALAPLTKMADEIEHLASSVVGQILDLLIDQFRDRQFILRTICSARLPLIFMAILQANEPR